MTHIGTTCQMIYVFQFDLRQQWLMYSKLRCSKTRNRRFKIIHLSTWSLTFPRIPRALLRTLPTHPQRPSLFPWSPQQTWLQRGCVAMQEHSKHTWLDLRFTSIHCQARTVSLHVTNRLFFTLLGTFEASLNLYLFPSQWVCNWLKKRLDYDADWQRSCLATAKK